MEEKLHTELFNAIKLLNAKHLTDSDKNDLLNLFNGTKNHAIRNQIALIFSDSHYNAAIPFIIKKINDEDLYNRNGTLVYALEGLDSLAYYVDVIKIICEQGYEARLMAYSIAEKLSGSISTDVKETSLGVLESYHLKQPEIDDADYKDSTLHFIESTQKLLLNSLK
ncbi:MAG: hypothetical protein V4456_02060 [Bacteroidota bacterium]